MWQRGERTSATPMRGTTFQVSLLRCRKTGRVLFVEAGKDFVDTLFSFLLLPVGTIINMLSTAGVGGQVKALGGMSSLYESVKSLDPSFMHVDKTGLVQPRPAYAGACGSIGLLKGLEASKMKRPSHTSIELPALYYPCLGRGTQCGVISSAEGTLCKTCKGLGYKSNFNHPVPLSVPPEELQALKVNVIEEVVKALDPTVQAEVPWSSSADQGVVRGNITYMVTDSLEVMPSTTIRSIQVLNKLKVASLADMESTDITVTITQILQLLQSAMTSNTCLNDVFSGKK